MPEEADPFEAEQARAFIDDAGTHLAGGKAVALAIRAVDVRIRPWDR